MNVQSFSYMEKGVKVSRQITGTIYTHGKRIYTMIDPNDPEKLERTGIADDIDKYFLTKKTLVNKRRNFNARYRERK